MGFLYRDTHVRISTPLKKSPLPLREGTEGRGNIKCFLTLTLCLLFLECLSGCSFHIPKIIVLDDPLSPEEHLNLGVSYEKNGEYDNAIKEYTVASKRLPVAYLYIGNVYFLKNDLREAEKYYKKAIQKDPLNADAHNNLAWLYYTEGENLTEAETLALKAIALDPSKKDTYQDTLCKIRDARAD